MANSLCPRATAAVRLGFLGVGWIGHQRLQALQASGRAAIVGIADAQQENARRALALAPEARLAGSLEELLQLDLDALVIATPSAQHAAQAVAALENRLAVFCQKPLGCDAAETRRVVEAARRADRLLGVDLSYRAMPAVHAMRELIRSGELGEVFAADLVFHNAYGPDKSWYYDRQLSGGGCLVDLGIHVLDLGLWLLDWPAVREVRSRLVAQGKPLADERAVEDFATAEIALAGGASLRLACSWRLSAGQDAVFDVTLYGTHGAVSLRNANGSFYDFTAEQFVGTSRRPIEAPTAGWFGKAAVDWLEQLTFSHRFDREAEHLVDVAAVLDSVRQGGCRA